MDLSSALFDGWDGIAKICMAAPIMYLAVITSIRIIGKRSTSQMNNFDWIVTVAIGSLSASGIILDSVTVTEAMTAIALLLGAQYLLTKGIIFSDRVAKFAKASPTLLVHDGEFLHDSMRCERVTPSEVMAALRENGLISVKEAQWVILETDATMSVIAKGNRDFSSPQFENISGFPPKGT